MIEGDKYGFLGRITELSLPESERLALNEKAFQTRDFHPTGRIEILLSFDLFDPFKVKRGLNAYPNIGAKVFVCSGELVQEYMIRFGSKDYDMVNAAELGCLVSDPSTKVYSSLQSLFGRHCAVVGTTGGGKSYSVSKLLETLTLHGNKAILIDATGEYDGNYSNLKSIEIGDGKHVFHYTQLSIDDLFYLFRPSPKTQAPKFMEAIKSLKIASLNGGENLFSDAQTPVTNSLITRVEDGIIRKSGSDKRPFNAFYYKRIGEIENGYSTFDISKLIRQISEECVWDSDQNNHEKWGSRNQTDIGYCVSLLSRINNIVNGIVYQNIFGFNQAKNDMDLCSIIDAFLVGPEKLLRLNFGNIPFDFQVREILANAIGTYLLNKARKKEFTKFPTVLFIDEAHQFLNKTIQDEFFDVKPLNAFDSIAKECRKHGLFLCIATQMPRDIPQGTLSQMGTFIVHRLINQNDKEAIANACSSANRNTLEFLPILGEGEAILTGVDFAMPVILKFHQPTNRPNSETPKLKRKF